MHDTFDLDSFAADIKNRIISGQNPTDIRKYIRRERGIGKSQGNTYYSKIEKSLTKKERAAIPRVEVEVKDVGFDSFREEGDTAVAEFKGIQTLAELIEAAEVDLEVWEVVKSAVSVYRGNFSVRAEFRKKVEEGKANILLRVFADEAKKLSPQKLVIKKPAKGDFKLLALNLADAHFGKKGVISGERKTSEIFKETVDELLNKAISYSSFDQAVFIVGNDLFNCDGMLGQTTAGTQVANEDDWYEIYREVCRAMTETIGKLSSCVAGKVTVIITPGNHDYQSCFTLGEYLEAWFRHDDQIEIQNDKGPRKYFTYYNNLFCLTHGNEEKPVSLPLIMAVESQDWSRCSNREIWLGHWHALKIVEDKGVVTRIFPSLSKKDAWHEKRGFIGNNQVGQVLVYDKNGLDAMFQYKPDPREN